MGLDEKRLLTKRLTCGIDHHIGQKLNLFTYCSLPLYYNQSEYFESPAFKKSIPVNI